MINGLLWLKGFFYIFFYSFNLGWFVIFTSYLGCFFLHFLNLLFNPCCFLILYFDFKFYFLYVLVSTWWEKKENYQKILKKKNTQRYNISRVKKLILVLIILFFFFFLRKAQCRWWCPLIISEKSRLKSLNFF
jgi:hypothetical protein